MFGIEDPGIWMAYLMSIGCVVFAAVYGIVKWNEEDKSDNPKNEEQ